MIAWAMGTATVLRGTTTDDYGDTVDGVTEVLTAVPWAVMERRVLVTTTDDPDPRFVTTYTGRMPAGTAIATGDRVRDDATDQVYMIDHFTEVRNPFVRMDLRLDLRRVS